MSLDKKSFIKRFVKDSKNILWPKEMAMVNKLVKIYPNDIFWEALELKFKLNSLCWFFSNEGRKFLNIEYKKFNIEIPEVKKFKMENNNVAFELKSPYSLERSLNLREFLNLWQKKT